MKTIFKKQVSEDKFVAVVLASVWFENMKISYPILPNDFVLCTWHDYPDGQKSNIEAKLTLAICRKKSDAKLLFDAYAKIIE